MELRRWVYTPTLESDAHLLPPRAFHADASRLVQILRDDHYGARLSPEAWERLTTWIDLNAPFHGTWKEVVASDPVKVAAAQLGAQRRRELHRQFAGIDEDPEAILPAAVLDAPPMAAMPPIQFENAPAATPPAAPSNPEAMRIEMGEGVGLELVRIEPGPFTMGADNGYPNERPARACAVDAPFLMGKFEITNQQFRFFDPAHDSGLETGEAYQFGDDERGFTLNRPEQPAVRVSCEQAEAFCEWLSAKTGRRFSLPTEAQWEYACRAGSSSPMWYGGLDTDFGRFANLSDATHHTVYYHHVPGAIPPWRPADTRFDDGWRVSARVGSFAPNPFGLFDMHGNAAEWVNSDYEPGGGRKVVRGGSWLDCPNRARSSFRLHYAASQAVHDVGFRVVCEP
jgi:formylglycine-generating enzyme required for sulfatase activity